MTFRKFALFAAFAAALSVGAVDAYARPGGGSSVGSRGAKTYTAPPSTRTAPNSASPIERSVTPQSGPSRPGVSQPSTGGFGRGLMGGLLGGLLGAGLFGMLFGHGLMGGMGGNNTPERDQDLHPDKRVVHRDQANTEPVFGELEQVRKRPGRRKSSTTQEETHGDTTE